MNRLIMLAALMLTVIGGLTIVLGSSPLSAQGGPGAVRVIDSPTVLPEGTVDVAITLTGTDAFVTVTETLPAGFAYGSSSLGADQVTVKGQDVTFVPLGVTSFTYTATAPMDEGLVTFSGTLNISPGNSVAVSGDSSVDVRAVPLQTGPDVVVDNLNFDVVSSKAVKGDRVSAVGNAIATNPLTWEIDKNTDMTFVRIDDGVVGGADGGFEVMETGDGEFGLFVIKSGAAVPGDSMAINVDVIYDDNGEERTSTLMGTIHARDDLKIDEPVGPFTISEGIADDTLIGAFTVTGDIAGEYLDGILSGDGWEMFSVNDEDMTISFEEGELEVKTYELMLTVSGDAGLANRADIVKVAIEVAKSNTPPMVPASFTPPALVEDLKGAGLVSAETPVGGIVVTDDDAVTYSLDAAGDAVFDIDGDGNVTVGDSDIADNPSEGNRSDGGIVNEDGDVVYSFNIMVSDGITANVQTVPATVTVDANAPVELAGDAKDGNGVIERAVTFPSDAKEELLLTLEDLVIDPDGNDIEFTLEDTGEISPIDIIMRDDKPVLVLTYVPRGSEGVSHSVRIDATDEYNANSDGSADVSIDVTIILTAGKPIRTTIREDVAETVAAGHVVAEMADSLDELGFEGEDIRFESIAGNGEDKFDVAQDGVVSVKSVVGVDQPLDIDSAGLAAGNFTNYLVTVEVRDYREATGGSVKLGEISLSIEVTPVNEMPTITNASTTAYVSERAQDKGEVLESSADGAGAYMLTAFDPEGAISTFKIQNESDVPFTISGDKIIVVGNNMLDYDAKGGTGEKYELMIVANDGANNSDSFSLTINVGNENEAPWFTEPTDGGLTIDVDEGPGALNAVYYDGGQPGDLVRFKATDTEDPGALEFSLKNQDDSTHFEIDKLTGVLKLVAALNYDLEGGAGTEHLVEVNVTDPQEATAEVQLRITVNNLNDETPEWDSAPPKAKLRLKENEMRGHVLANYAATDPDYPDDPNAITYSVKGQHGKSFEMMPNGDLVTLESIDIDGKASKPCGVSCNVIVVADDGGPNPLTEAVVIEIIDAEDSVSTLDIFKANPVPGPNAGKAESALSGTKTTRSAAVPERPADIPAAITEADLDNDGTPDIVDNAVNFVETEWANWGTVLLIEITSESPDANCGNGNQCVVVDLESDSADDKLSVQAYRSAHQENKFLAAVKLVGRSASSGDGDSDHGYLMPTEHRTPGGIRPRDLGATPGDAPVYNHRNQDGSVYRNAEGMTEVPRIHVDEEDEISIAFDNLRDSVEVENDPPEIDSFAPGHESAFDDADVDYTFRITDSLSGIPSPEDLPDTDSDDNYIPVIAVVSQMPCKRPVVDIGNNRTIRADVAQCRDSNDVAKYGKHEYDATTVDRDEWGYIAVREDKDFDEISNGYEVETTLVLDDNKIFYVTFVAVDRAGNMIYFDPDGSDDDVEYAKIVIDTGDPQLYEARAGVTWDEGDEEYDDDRSVIQVIFNDLTQLNPATVEIDDFVVEGHTIVAANVYEQPDDWTDDSRYASGGEMKYRDPDGLRLRQSIDTSVFLHLEDELQADETPDVTLVPNGIEDVAGNEQDDGEAEADDWISPAFTIVSIVSPRTTTENPNKVLAGDGDEVVFNVTVDERLNTARPTVTVSYVDASMVDTKGVASCDNGDGDSDMHDGKRKRGEITMSTSGETSALCADNNIATDHNLKTTIEKVTNTEWIITVGEPKGTGYYNFHIDGKDRSAQQNPGSEGVDPDAIVTKFYDSDGDVNVDDAVFFEGDINLPKPNVRLSGTSITDNEPSVEYRSRLFLEIDFTKRYEDAIACENLPSLSDNYRLANCMNENSEYSKDSFDDVVITSFMLDGVDITDQVNESTTDRNTFLATLENIGLGDHEVKIQAMDQAGNELEDTLEVDFEVDERDPFEKRLSPGWNLISLPGEPADSSIASVIGPGVEVRTVYTYNPVVPGGWQVAVRETLDSEWQGDLTEITGQRGYWVLSDAIQDWEVSIPRLAGGAVGTGTPIQPPVIPLYAGWNLIPVTDVKGNALDHGTPISAATYLQSLEDGIEAARVLGFDTIRNEWYTVLDGDMMSPGMGTNLLIGSGYWVFVRNATALVPGGVAGSGGSGD